MNLNVGCPGDSVFLYCFFFLSSCTPSKEAYVFYRGLQRGRGSRQEPGAVRAGDRGPGGEWGGTVGYPGNLKLESPEGFGLEGFTDTRRHEGENLFTPPGVFRGNGVGQASLGAGSGPALVRKAILPQGHEAAEVPRGAAPAEQVIPEVLAKTRVVILFQIEVEEPFFSGFSLDKLSCCVSCRRTPGGDHLLQS